MSFFTELKRRNVFRIGAAYVLFAWVAAAIVRWRDPDAPERIVPFNDGGKGESEQELRVELPTRFEFIRNHFPYTAAIRPSSCT